jgi:hypothetical protein
VGESSRKTGHLLIQQKPHSFASWVRWVVLPPAKEGAYPPSIRIMLTLSMFVGLGMIFLSFLKPFADFDKLGHRSCVMGLGGLILACMSVGLRYSTKTTVANNDWLRLRELYFLIGLALSVIATDIYYSQKIGLLAYPPYYDGVHYMFEAKYAFLHLGMWKQHPVTFGYMILGNRYPIWKALMIMNFRLFGVGEWQSYAVRFWPTLVILMTAFWVVRRRTGLPAACTAALFTALLPTLSLNFRSAAVGHPVFPRGYLADLRPDILFAAFVTLSVVLMIEHAHTFDEWTALLSGISGALAVLTKSTAIPAVVLACGMASVYVLFINRRNLRKTLQIMLWALLAFTILLMPWLPGGLETTIAYVREILTTQLPRYSNAHPTIRSELTYNWFWLVEHMGWVTVVFATASSIFLFLSYLKGKAEKSSIHDQLTYFIIAAALYGLVSATLMKNYFVGLPCYLILWIYCWVSLTSLMTTLKSAKSDFTWGLLSLAIMIVGVTGIKGVRNINAWKGHEFEEGQQDRAALQQIAMDLRHVLSNNQSFISMPAYGSPATLLFYMPDRQGEFPQATFVNGTNGPPIQEFIRQAVEPAKAVLVYSNGNRDSSFKGWAAVDDFPYYRAVAAWVQRPGSSYHLVKTYDLYPDRPSHKAVVELYVQNDQDHTVLVER